MGFYGQVVRSDSTELTYNKSISIFKMVSFQTKFTLYYSVFLCTSVSFFVSLPLQKKIWIAICLAILILILVISLASAFGT